MSKEKMYRTECRHCKATTGGGKAATITDIEAFRDYAATLRCSYCGELGQSVEFWECHYDDAEAVSNPPPQSPLGDPLE